MQAWERGGVQQRSQGPGGRRLPDSERSSAVAVPKPTLPVGTRKQMNIFPWKAARHPGTPKVEDLFVGCFPLVALAGSIY